MMKKYFSLLETSQILEQPVHKIRYLQKINKVDTYKVNQRNYFNLSHIKEISWKIRKKIISSEEIEYKFYLLKINTLIEKFSNLV